MLTCENCGCDVGVVEVAGAGVGGVEMKFTAMCARCYRSPAAQRFARRIQKERAEGVSDGRSY